jgi:transcriptional regulator with GAF, ATPase, and Fis domain
MQAVQKNLSRFSSNTMRSVLGHEQNNEMDESRLEALKVLSYSILSEVESLKREKSRYALVKIDLATEVQNYEASLIRCALMRTGGNQRRAARHQRRAARLLGIKITTLNAKIKRYGITPSGLALEDE